MRPTIPAIILAGMVSSCGTPEVAGIDYNPAMYDYQSFWATNDFNDEQDVHLPPIGAATTTEVGDSMISKIRVRKRVNYTLRESHDVTELFSKRLDVFFRLPAGTYVPEGTDSKGGRYYAAPTGIRVNYVERGKPPTPSSGQQLRGGIFISASGKSYAYLFWSNHTNPFKLPAPGLKLDTTSTVEPAVTASFRMELVYVGRSQSTVNILYREFLNDMARPAFSQSLQYDVSTSPVIGYKGARFEVLQADNTSISFRVLRHLE